MTLLVTKSSKSYAMLVSADRDDWVQMCRVIKDGSCFSSKLDLRLRDSAGALAHDAIAGASTFRILYPGQLDWLFAGGSRRS